MQHINLRMSCLGMMKSCNGANIVTAGQRVDPSKKTEFVWKPTPGKNIPVIYTNWTKYSPKHNFYTAMDSYYINRFGLPSCLSIWPDRDYMWNDVGCKNRPCSLCEYY